MSGRRNKHIKNLERLSPELTISEQLNAGKKFIKKLRERKKEYQELLIQIDNFIEYAKDQAKNNDSNGLRLKYWDAVNEEESLRDKIQEHLKKNDELIESIKNSKF
ncbi:MULTISPECIES: hypothetical protein [Methanobacterium]|jgi:hypothetical protein|uniref:Uncharacterized protein n=1 Tax=Methanobacterium veterum TaxID=408577 RepID=A0A9E5DL06_9EURY|nr:MULTISPECIES: hypothetical protein [Methanobacterium]MCZ3365110.1 hypothetical protein [Methanobacterium veterum]MCZ3372865.1 hypothetical protein [Methanobacterium veterum]